MTDNVHTVQISAAEKGERLDRVLAQRLTAFSRSRLKALILAGATAIDKTTVRDPGHRVNAGDAITLIVPPDAPAEPEAEDIPLNIVHEDDALIVIDKPRGLVVHPAAGNPSGTLVNALIAHCGASLSGIGGVKRPGIVHRLDKDTTGLMVVAKNDRAHKALLRASSPIMAAAETWSANISPLSGARRTVRTARSTPRSTATPRPATSRRSGREVARRSRIGGCWKPTPEPTESRPPPSSPAGWRPGRTHQIRVHLAHIGHPLLGDAVYGPGFKTKSALLPENARESLAALGRQALHAHILGFQHPGNPRNRELQVPPARTI